MICGLLIDEDGKIRLCERNPDGGRAYGDAGSFRPFLWAADVPMADGMEVVPLSGGGEMGNLLFFDSMAVFRSAASDRSLNREVIRPVEAQYLMHERKRFFEGMSFAQLRRVTLDVVTVPIGEGDEEAVRAVGMILPDGMAEILEAEDASTQAERRLLKRFSERLVEVDPDVVEGHGIFNGALATLFARSRRYRVAVQWGRFGAKASVRKSRIRIAERWIDYQRCDLPGRSVFDTQIAVQIYDISVRELSGYELEEVVAHFRSDEPVALPSADPSAPMVVLEERLHGARFVSDMLLPTYFAQAQNMPLPLQEVFLRGSSAKVDSLLFERYYHARYSLPAYPPGAAFEGAFSHSFETGVFRHVLHYDVASLYPSLLLRTGRAPEGDTLNAFIPLLEELRKLRLEYKKLAREAASDELRMQYDARQRSFKILINSFYGYLGFPQARFADPALAADITRQGRELIQSLIGEFQRTGCRVLEADTDGIYLSDERHWENPESLLSDVAHLLPEGVNLEFDGRYEAMFCYKAKNYALLDEEGHVHVSGSAFRSRGMEPFLMSLTGHLVRSMLGVEPRPVGELVRECRERIVAGTMDVRDLARSEYLSMGPEAYRRKIEQGGKPRRASLEVALTMDPLPRMGERVSYYLAPKERGMTSDWQRAHALPKPGEKSVPYCPDYYLKRLDEWCRRFSQFTGCDEGQAELSLE